MLFSPDELPYLLLTVLGLPFLIGATLFLAPIRPERARGIALSATLLELLLGTILALDASDVLTARPVSTSMERAPIFQPIAIPGGTSVTVRTNLLPDESNRPSNFPYKTVDRTTWTLMPLSASTTATSAQKQPTGVQFFIGLDGLNLWLVLLACVMTPAAILVSWNSIRENQASFFAWIAILQGAVIGVFVSFDIVLFYSFFELTLVPVYFLVGIWGTGAMRREAARRMFLYTLAGSLLTLLGVILVVLVCWNRAGILTFSIPDLVEIVRDQMTYGTADDQAFWQKIQASVFLLLAVGFAVKIPLVPFHSWLPLGYAEAPIGVTLLLSSLLAKMGTYGLVRLCLPLAPDATLSFGLPLLGLLGAVGIIYGSLCAFAQTDLKRMIAYSSVAHLGFCVLGIVAFNTEGVAGGTLHMVNHGLSTGALFLLVGLYLDRYGSAQIASASGLWAKLPVFTFFLMSMSLASIGLPGLNNFVSEMLMLGALFHVGGPPGAGLGLAACAAFGIFLSAWYMLTMLQQMFFGELKEPASVTAKDSATDLCPRELGAIAPLALLCLLLGCCPQPLLNLMDRDAQALSGLASDARERAGQSSANAAR